MTKETMTIHQALAEKKLLENRLYKKIDELKICVANVKAQEKVEGIGIERFKAEQKANFESITDLIKRYKAIKRAITKSNAITTVKVDEVEYTIAEAIWMKQEGTTYDDLLLDKISKTYARAKRECDTHNTGLIDKANAAVTASLGGDKNQLSTEKYNERVATFVEQNTYEIVEAVACEKEKQILEDYLDSFKAKVDAALSVSNATTMITIEY